MVKETAHRWIDNPTATWPDISSTCLFHLFNKQNKLNLLVSLIFLATTRSYITLANVNQSVIRNDNQPYRYNSMGKVVHLLLYCHWHHHNDTINKQTQEDFFNKICTSHFIVRVRKGYSRFYCEKESETEHNCNILTPTLMAVNVVSFSFSRAAQPEAQWPTLLSDLLRLICTPTHQGPKAPSAWCGFPYHISSITPSDL